MNEQALDKFTGNVFMARQILEEIQKELGDGMNINPNSVSWNHVGDSQHVLESLREIDRFLRDRS